MRIDPGALSSNYLHMIQRVEKRITTNEIPRICQKLRLACVQCGKQHTYDVGTIFHYDEPEEKPVDQRFAFSNYFRCRECGSAGPWRVADYMKMLGLALRARVDVNYTGLVEGRFALFDGTFAQTPAIGEEHLLELHQKDPNNAFLCTRLGNLFRGCGEQPWAVPWYEKAVALDPRDIEARYHLYSFAVEDCDVAAALKHGALLVRHLLDGQQAEKEELTAGIACFVVQTLRESPPECRTEFFGDITVVPEPPERTFIRTLLETEGDEEEIQTQAVQRLLEGESEPTHFTATLSEAGVDSPDEGSSIELIPALGQLVAAEGLNARNLSVPVEANNQGRIRVVDRHLVPLFDGRKLADWPVASLRELFRGNRSAPADIERYPPEYCGHFFFIERHLLTVCDAQGDPTDQEMKEIFSMIRRRPDGRSQGSLHDFLFQVAALTLGMYVLSQAEFEAIFGQLARSTRRWQERPVSRNYVSYLRSTFLSLDR